MVYTFSSDICWVPELGLFVAVSISGNTTGVATSSNGTTWTTRTTVANNWSSVCWSPELALLVAVSQSGTGNRVMTSPNGTTWTTRVSAADNTWNKVVWAAELGLFVAVSSSGTLNRVMTSPDGITWTTRTTNDDNWNCVTWSPELYLFVSVSSTTAGQRVMTSPDGITWTTRATPQDNSWQSVFWSPELSIFVAVSSDGTNRVISSSDGMTWTTQTTPASGMWAVCWSSELSIFTAVGDAVVNSRIALPASKSTMLISPAYMTETDGNIRFTGTMTASNLIVTSSTITSLMVTGGGLSATFNSNTIGNIFTTGGNVGIATTAPTSTLHINGSLAKSSGTFDIQHPLNNGKRLVHSFIEGPRCDLIYRGSVTLVNGAASVNIDTDCVAESDCSMSAGTFEALVTNHDIFLQNKSNYDKVRGTVSGNILTIVSNNNTSNAIISWMIIAERKDPYIKTWDKTNDNGYLKTEYIP